MKQWKETFRELWMKETIEKEAKGGIPKIDFTFQEDRNKFLGKFLNYTVS